MMLGQQKRASTAFAISRLIGTRELGVAAAEDSSATEELAGSRAACPSHRARGLLIAEVSKPKLKGHPAR